MTDREILSNAIDKAIANGFKFEKDMVPPVLLMEYEEKIWDYTPYRNQLNGFLFSHSFAKAFWGKDQISEGFAGTSPAWQYHLREMVLEENPIEYLEKFL